MTDVVRIGFIGCGQHATQNLYPTFRLGVTGGSAFHPEPIGTLVACCDLDEDRARLNAREFGFDRSYTDYRAMLEKEELDCVFCVMHPRDQWKVALECLEAGKPVFVEKPPTETLEAAYALKEACSHDGLFVMPAFMKRFSLPYLEALRLKELPEFGASLSFEARYNFGTYMPHEVYDFLNGFSCHVLDLSRFLMGEVQSVYALYAAAGRDVDGRRADYRRVLAERPESDPQEEAWLLGLTFTSGAVGFIQTNCLERVQERVAITGRRSWVIVDDWRRVTAYVDDSDTPYVWAPHDQMPIDAMDFRTIHGYTGEVRHFVECVRTGATPSLTIDDGIEHLRLELAAKRSAREGRPVELAEVS
jgi:myo-inositol 2-dehydrogenase/D-chiro-inositol 1-dehydrogenase